MDAQVSILKSRRVIGLIALAVVVSLLVPMLIGGREAFTQIRALPPDKYLTLFAVMALSWLARATKLHVLFERLGTLVPFGRSFAMSLAIDFAFISTPAGVGGYAASMYFARRAGMSLSGATTLTFVDQLLDLMFFALALPLAAISLMWSDAPRALSLAAFCSSAALIVLALVIILMHRRFMDWFCGDNIFTRRWPSLRERRHRVLAFLDNVHADWKLLISGPPTATALLIGSTAMQWLTRYGILWVALALLGHAVPFALTLMSQSLILHAAMWTGVPSGGGGAELGLTATLLTMASASAIAPALILWRLTTFHLCLVAGMLAIGWLARWRPRAMQSMIEEEVADTNLVDTERDVSTNSAT